MNFDPTRIAKAQVSPERTGLVHPLVAELLAAGTRYNARTDSFAAGKGQTCADMAHKLQHYGRFASEKQESFARKLIEWSKPRKHDEGAR